MFGKKKQIPQIDKEQLALIKYAEKRIKQKKRVYIHFVIFLIGSVFLIIANTILGIGKDTKIFGLDWFVIAVVLWLSLFIYHFITVFITHSFMGKDWEDQQLELLVAKQQERIEKLKQEYLKEEKEIAKSEAYNQAQDKPTTSEKKKTEITIIVAAGENNAIGKDNDLIWHLSDDLKRFKSLTNGHHIIMGRKTFESFPRPLPNRTHVVITRQKDYKAPDGVIIVNNLEDALDAARRDPQPFIIGGGEIYKQSMSIADKLEITRVHHSFEDADTFFPEIDKSIWTEVSREYRKKDEKHAYDFTFITYLRA
ncbi:dihydrofolate reductase [Psychroserpens sp.]|uniref:dihydrofolate reductase n=1 Tax=Psychroserpens sp. TaxID=2020870 RepID=UPI001B03652D|nr:dihydrofolate reductase [Psychroserpens sp.]MBO6607900.1 dihydrofolate reductase [Psychroserpens sp.]MBO6631819.1 dihydrofolate reductase [Psychroserpens sp.]MBO6654973.1 dihydrofolate reductase [Psychroserpens sp.]MBO6682953.1 dihydrofolate reductase [Psychroserpens sp.]MBO6751258.1 dihydrofolate reductase [Psychroserpens sp.]